jgi:cytochrome c biogenesis protein CcmG/thiol:disulfide interchange protein DsbE
MSIAPIREFRTSRMSCFALTLPSGRFPGLAKLRQCCPRILARTVAHQRTKLKDNREWFAQKLKPPRDELQHFFAEGKYVGSWHIANIAISSYTVARDQRMSSPLSPAGPAIRHQAPLRERPTNRRRWVRPVLLAMAVLLITGSYCNHWLSVSGARTDTAHRQRIPDLDFSKWGGGRWRVSDHRGRVVLINFWATWCPPCPEETPGLVHLAQHMPSKDVAIVGISMEDDSAPIAGFVNAYRIPYRILLRDPSSPLLGPVESLPTSLLIDRNGRVARSYVGPSPSRHLPETSKNS